MLLDSKRFGKKLTTLYWVILTSLPIIQIITQMIQKTPFEISNYEIYRNVSLTSINSVIDNAINSISNNNMVNYIMGYMISIQFYHLLFDVFTFVICYSHKILDNFLERTELD